MKGMRVAIDIAKGVFEVVVVNGRSQVELKKRWRRGQLLKELAKLEPCVVAMETCGSAHYWGREIGKLGAVDSRPSGHAVPAGPEER